MKKLVFFTLLILSFSNVSGQLLLNMQLGPQVPMNSAFRANYSTGFGLSASGKYAVSSSRLYGLTAATGRWGAKNPYLESIDGRYGMNSFYLGREDYFNEDRLRVFSIAEAGLLFLRFKGDNVDEEASSTIFLGVNAGAGVLYELKERLYLQASGKLNINYSSNLFGGWFSFLGVNVGVAYRIGG